MSNSLQDQLMLLHDPFAEVNSKPKIPDGRQNSSLGFQSRRVFQATFDAATNTGHFLLVPHVRGSCCVHGANTVGSGASGRGYEIFGFGNDFGVSHLGATDASTSYDSTSQTQLSEFRTVSCGMRLKLLNAAEADEGWWEAIRFEPKGDGGDFYVTTIDNAVNADDTSVIFPVGLIDNQLEFTNLANHPSYSTGLLRDLHQVQFNLNRTATSAGFVKVEETRNIGAGGMTGNDTMIADPRQITGDTTSTILVNAAQDEIDSAMDYIYVRVHTTNSTVDTSFHCDVIHNLELYYDIEATENRYQDGCHNIGASAISMHLSAQKANNNAATLIG
jgi:hypothetical protein